MNPYLTPNYKIKNVIFNAPATIVLWSDGTKTVVKCQDGDEYDPEKGLAMAISKKALGNKGNYCNELKKWLPKKYLCMYCGAETTNPDWNHMCDECKNKPLDPIPENLKKKLCYDIKLPDTSRLADAVKAFRNFGKTVNEMNKKSAIQKAYDILVKGREDHGFKNEVLDEAIDYLSEALED